MTSTFQNRIYAAEYCPCCHESSYGILSLHWTHEGATEAIVEHEAEQLAIWKEMGYNEVPNYELWRVYEYEVQE